LEFLSRKLIFKYLYLFILENTVYSETHAKYRTHGTLYRAAHRSELDQVARRSFGVRGIPFAERVHYSKGAATLGLLIHSGR
jgi:hypothetical protein